VGWDHTRQSVSLLDGLSSRLVLEKTRDAKMNMNMKDKTSLLNLSLLDAVQAGKEERKKIFLERKERREERENRISRMADVKGLRPLRGALARP
jgi:hypothetical protein